MKQGYSTTKRFSTDEGESDLKLKEDGVLDDNERRIFKKLKLIFRRANKERLLALRGIKKK